MFYNIISSNSGFNFIFDTANGKFQWIINPVKDDYKNKRFECFNGTNTVSVIATFDEKGLKSYVFAKIIAVIIFFNIIIVIVILLYRWINGKDILKVQPKKSQNKEEAQDKMVNPQDSESRRTGLKESSTWLRVFKLFWIPLVYFLVGIILTVILILVTRFSEDSVVEVYEDICGWEILLILFGIYMFTAICLLVVLIIIVVKKVMETEKQQKGLLELHPS